MSFLDRRLRFPTAEGSACSLDDGSPFTAGSAGLWGRRMSINSRREPCQGLRGGSARFPASFR